MNKQGKPNTKELTEQQLKKCKQSNALLQVLFMKYIAQVIKVNGSNGLRNPEAVKKEFFNEPELDLIQNFTNESEKIIQEQEVKA